MFTCIGTLMTDFIDLPSSVSSCILVSSHLWYNTTYSFVHLYSNFNDYSINDWKRSQKPLVFHAPCRQYYLVTNTFYTRNSYHGSNFNNLNAFWHHNTIVREIALFDNIYLIYAQTRDSFIMELTFNFILFYITYTCIIMSLLWKIHSALTI